jgi:hypothetical protein
MHCCTVDCAVVSAHEHFASVRLQVDGVFVRQVNYRACESTRYAQFLSNIYRARRQSVEHLQYARILGHCT